METWRLLESWDAEPGFNMALDEALLGRGGPSPTLRFYTWHPDTLSLGYFQRWRDVAGIEHAGSVVRRMTGGGAIHHANELTFSIAAPLDHPLYRGAVAASYERVHALIAEALRPSALPRRRAGTRSWKPTTVREACASAARRRSTSSGTAGRASARRRDGAAAACCITARSSSAKPASSAGSPRSEPTRRPSTPRPSQRRSLGAWRAAGSPWRAAPPRTKKRARP